MTPKKMNADPLSNYQRRERRFPQRMHLQGTRALRKMFWRLHSSNPIVLLSSHQLVFWICRVVETPILHSSLNQELAPCVSGSIIPCHLVFTCIYTQLFLYVLRRLSEAKMYVDSLTCMILPKKCSCFIREHAQFESKSVNSCLPVEEPYKGVV